MTNTEQAIHKALGAGWNPTYQILPHLHKTHYSLDPLFWKCLGKSLGWEEPETGDDFLEAVPLDLNQTGWNARWHSFIDALIAGKTPEEYFTTLLSDHI